MCECKGFLSDVIASHFAEKKSLVKLKNKKRKKGMWDVYVLLQILHLQTISLWVFFLLLICSQPIQIPS